MSEAFDERFEGQEAEVPEFPDEMVEDLQNLTVIGHLSDSFSYGGQDFVIRTMTIGEELEALRCTRNYNDIPVAAGRVYATAMVAGAVQSLNGQPLVIPISDKQNVMALKFAKVMEWFWPVIEVVYNRFSVIEKRQKDILDGLRNTLESPEDQEPTESLE